MPTDTETQDAAQQDQQASTRPETHQTQAQPESPQQHPLGTPPQTTPSTGTTGSASTTLGGTAMGSGNASATLPGTGSSTGSSTGTSGSSMGGGSYGTSGTAAGSSTGSSYGTSTGSSSPSSGSSSGLSSRRGSMSPASILGDPFGMMRSFMDQMDRFLDDFAGLGGLGRSRQPNVPSPRSFSGAAQGQAPGQGQSMGFWYPQVEVSEKGGNLVVCADLPGLRREDVQLEVHDDYLILEGERRNEREESQAGLYRTERSYGRFYRTIPLPQGTNPDQVRASFKDGVLEVTVPMPTREEQQRGRRIEIQ